jgi:MoaA/NifB/PqqE/SkfB family radical SAM enzyme
MRPLVCNYYLTYRCNDTCEFCDVWQRDELSEVAEAPSDVVRKNLKDAKKLGVIYVDFTGGEPLLRDDLPEILAYSKNLGLYNTLTTNCILYKERAKEIKGLVNRLLFSLDAPDSEEHERIRGVYSYEPVMESIKLAKELHENPIINFTLTRSSIALLPEMIDFCEKLNVMVWLNPVFGKDNLQGFDDISIEHIKYFFNRGKVGMDLAALELVKKKGNSKLFPKCKAASAVISISPDDKLILPCFYLQDNKIEINGKLISVYKSAEIQDLKRKQGRSDHCSECMAWPYLIPSFMHKIDKYFFLNLYSLWNFWWKEREHKLSTNSKKSVKIAEINKKGDDL